MNYRVRPCVHGFPPESCPLCGAEPLYQDALFGMIEEQADWPVLILADSWEPELCKSPEYQLNLHVPPAFWLKRDRDRFYDGLEALQAKGCVIW